MSDEKITISVVSPNSEQEVEDLSAWLKSEEMGARIETQRSSPKPGDMGGAEVLQVVQVVLGSAAVVEAVKAIGTWIGVRRPKVKLKVKRENQEVEIDTDGLSKEELDTLLTRLLPS